LLRLFTETTISPVYDAKWTNVAYLTWLHIVRPIALVSTKLYLDWLLSSPIGIISSTRKLQRLDANHSTIMHFAVHGKRDLPVFATIISLCLFAHCSGCPTGFTDTGGGICMIVFQSKLPICSAFKRCVDEGVARNLTLFLVGTHVDQAATAFPNITAWTGVNRFAEPVQGLTNWRVSDPKNTQTIINPNKWCLKSPNYTEPYRKDAVLLTNGCLKNIPSDQFHWAVCELATEPFVPSNRTVTITFSKDWPQQLRGMCRTDVYTDLCFGYKNCRDMGCCSLW
jgi:hypothetical protein